MRDVSVSSISCPIIKIAALPWRTKPWTVGSKDQSLVCENGEEKLDLEYCPAFVLVPYQMLRIPSILTACQNLRCDGA